VKRTPERNAELKRRRAQRKLWAERRARGLCFNCGGCEWVDSVDNTGAHYLGCARCVIVLPDPPPVTPDQ
jgi:hypothetical protein